MMVKRLLCGCLTLFFLSAILCGQTISELLELQQNENPIDMETLLHTYFPEPIKLHKLSPDSVTALWFLNQTQSRQLQTILLSGEITDLSYETLAALLKIPLEQVKIIFEIPQGNRTQISHRLRFKSASEGATK